MNKLPKNFFEPHALLGAETQAPVLVALSGGADSAGLLHMMCVCRKELGFKLYAAHVNHNIRTDAYGNEAARDEDFCHRLCGSLDVELFVLNADVPKMASECGESMETVARRVRYGFFSELMREQGIKILLTAHNANDNLETQIFNLCRGSGIQGLAGIPMIRDLAECNGHIARPLLRVSKDEIVEYCKQNSVDFVTDSTNFEQDYTRNRLRARVLPELCEIFGNPLSASARLAILAREDADYMNRSADTALAEPNCFAINFFNSQHAAIKRRLISRKFAELCDASLEATHLDAVISLAKRGAPHSRISLPCGVEARIEEGTLIFNTRRDTVAVEYDVPLSIGQNVIKGSGFAVVISKDPVEHAQSTVEIDGEIYRLYTSANIKNAKIHSLRARSRRQGDTIRTGNMTKKIKKLMCDFKVDIDDRDVLPLIEENGELILVPRCAVCDRVRARANDLEYTIYIFKRERI